VTYLPSLACWRFAEISNERGSRPENLFTLMGWREKIEPVLTISGLILNFAVAGFGN
jgi:hypothetical protein